MNKKEYIEEQLRKYSYLGSYTDLEQCKQCMGLCCYKGPCACHTLDLGGNVTREVVKELLATGKFMIATTYEVVPGMQTNLPIPLKAIPYISVKSVGVEKNCCIGIVQQRCAMIGTSGCLFTNEERPIQGLLFLPTETNQPCRQLMEPLRDVWAPYYSVLDSIVKEEMGKSTQELFEETIGKQFRDATESVEKAIKEQKPIPWHAYLAYKEFCKLEGIQDLQTTFWAMYLGWDLPEYPGYMLF